MAGSSFPIGHFDEELFDMCVFETALVSASDSVLIGDSIANSVTKIVSDGVLIGDSLGAWVLTKGIEDTLLIGDTIVFSGNKVFSDGIKIGEYLVDAQVWHGDWSSIVTLWSRATVSWADQAPTTDIWTKASSATAGSWSNVSSKSDLWTKVASATLGTWST